MEKESIGNCTRKGKRVVKNKRKVKIVQGEGRKKRRRENTTKEKCVKMNNRNRKDSEKK